MQISWSVLEVSNMERCDIFWLVLNPFPRGIVCFPLMMLTDGYLLFDRMLKDSNMHSVPRPRTGEQWIFGFCRGLGQRNGIEECQLQEKHLAPCDPIRSSSALSLLPYQKWVEYLVKSTYSFISMHESLCGPREKSSSAYLGW